MGRAMTRPTGSSRQVSRSTPECSRTWRSRGRHAVRSYPMPSCWPPAAPRSGSGWVRSTGWIRPAWRCSVPVTGPPARSRPATRISRSPTASRYWPRPGCAPWPNPAARSATTWSSRRPRPRVSRCTSPASGTSTTKGTGVTAQVLDGKALAAEIRAELTQRVAALAARGPAATGGKGSGVPGLGTVLVGDDPGSRAYVNGKHRDCAQVGIASIRRDLPADATQAQVEAVVDELNADPACTGYIVQLPLPPGLDAHAVLNRMDPAKDADGLHPANLGKLVLGEPGPLPCTPRGIVELLRRYGVAIAGADVTVIGRGITVGRALGLLLTRRTENATVTLCHTGTKDLAAHTRTADIVVVAAGRPGLLTADMVKPGAAVVDVGITRTDTGLVGDVAPEIAEVAGWLAPMPGGVGPMTRAMLLANVVEAAESANP